MQQPKTTKHIGRLAEDYVAAYLRNAGFSLLEQSYRTSYGEIDIIARKNNMIVFVEVKYRRSPSFDIGLVIVPSKQKKIIMVANTYLARHNISEIICRFDVALVQGTEMKLLYLENSFQNEYE